MWTGSHYAGAAPHGGPSGWGRWLPEGQRAFISSDLQKERPGYLIHYCFSKCTLRCFQTSSASRLACLGHLLPLLAHNFISPASPQPAPATAPPQTQMLPWGAVEEGRDTEPHWAVGSPLGYGVLYSLSLPQGVGGCPQHCDPRNLTAEGAEAPQYSQVRPG